MFDENLPNENPPAWGVSWKGYPDNVASVDKAAAKIEKLGGKICMPKSAVPQMGYFAICLDMEGNQFALWERDKKAS